MLVNGDPATGSIAFSKNNSKELPYDGYFNMTRRQTASGFRGLLRNGEEIMVPDDAYVALGTQAAIVMTAVGICAGVHDRRSARHDLPFSKRFH